MACPWNEGRLKSCICLAVGHIIIDPFSKGEYRALSYCYNMGRFFLLAFAAQDLVMMDGVPFCFSFLTLPISHPSCSTTSSNSEDGAADNVVNADVLITSPFNFVQSVSGYCNNKM